MVHYIIVGHHILQLATLTKKNHVLMDGAKNVCPHKPSGTVTVKKKSIVLHTCNNFTLAGKSPLRSCVLSNL